MATDRRAGSCLCVVGPQSATTDLKEVKLYEVSQDRVALLGEMLLLFVGGPFLLSYLVYERHVPLFIVLPFVLAGFLTLLFRQRDQSWRADLARVPDRRDLLSILAVFVVCGGALTVFAYYRYPESFLTFPRFNRPLWLLVMVFYPLFSVTTQELLYRVLFFDRYAGALNGASSVAILANAALFASMHAILFAYHSRPFHWEAVAISFIGGLLFAYRFTRTRSFLAVVLEHALYGDLIFTIGLGRFFFTGVAHL
jgi:uncharacterized protein